MDIYIHVYTWRIHITVYEHRRKFRGKEIVNLLNLIWMGLMRREGTG